MLLEDGISFEKSESVLETEKGKREMARLL